MMRTTLIMMLAAALAGCSKDDKAQKADEGAAAQPAENTTAAKAAPTPAPTRAEEPWETFTDEEYGFTVEAPNAPKKTVNQIPSPAGSIPSPTYMFSKPSDPGALMVMVTPVPGDGTIDFDEGQKGALAFVNGTTVSQEDFEFGGQPARQFRFTGSAQGHSLQGRARMLVQGNKLYQLVMIHMDGDDKQKAIGERFVDSFQFVPAKG